METREDEREGYKKEREQERTNRPRTKYQTTECDCKRETKRKFFSWTSDAPTAC